VLELWKVLDSAGALTAAAVRETLGRELTEAAVLRALCELWQGLRVSPVFAEEGQPTSWEMLRVRHREALTTGAATSQVTALSLLVSTYLQSVYAASSEEIEIFLSPVASRSRVREAVRGLSATRQIHSLSMDAQTYYFLQDGLPEFAPLASPAPAAGEAEPRQTAPQAGAGTRPLPAQRPTQRKDLAARQVPLAAPPAGHRPEAERIPRRKLQPQPAARAERRSGPGPRVRPPWRPAGKPPTSGPPRRWPEKERAAGSKVGPTPGSQPNPTGGARPETRGGARPETRGGARPEKRPAPWSRPARPPGTATRPAQASSQGKIPFRPPQKHVPVPGRGPERGPGGAVPRRLPQGERSPGETSRPRSYRAPGRPQGPPAARANRPNFPGRPSGRPAPFRPKEGSGGPPRGGRPGAARPGRFAGPRKPVPPAPATGGPPATRLGQSSGAGANRGAKYDRPRPAGFAKSGAKSASGRGDERGRPPFVPRPPKSWPRAGNASGKPAKPVFRGGKPGRKKPGV
jgi:23S rRNA pseudouridine2605 synthase